MAQHDDWDDWAQYDKYGEVQPKEQQLVNYCKIRDPMELNTTVQSMTLVPVLMSTDMPVD